MEDSPLSLSSVFQREMKTFLKPPWCVRHCARGDRRTLRGGPQQGRSRSQKSQVQEGKSAHCLGGERGGGPRLSAGASWRRWHAGGHCRWERLAQETRLASAPGLRPLPGVPPSASSCQTPTPRPGPSCGGGRWTGGFPSPRGTRSPSRLFSSLFPGQTESLHHHPRPGSPALSGRHGAPRGQDTCPRVHSLGGSGRDCTWDLDCLWLTGLPAPFLQPGPGPGVSPGPV